MSNKVLLISDMEGGGAGTIAKLINKYLDNTTYIYNEQMYSSKEQLFNSIYRSRMGLEFPLRDIHILNKISKDYDLLHFHNLHGMKWSIKLLYKINKKLPIVWTLHDMWSITGKCPYPYECTQYKSLECSRNSCRYLIHYPYYRHVRSNILLKRKLINAMKNLVMVTPSKWLHDEVSDIYKNADIRVINNGVDIEMFNNKRNLIGMQILKASKNKPTILNIPSIGSDYYRKGTDIAQDILNETVNDFNWITFGSGALNGAHNFGWVPTDIRPYFYASAEIYLHTARMDNWPSTILESLASGCKCVALNSGGVPEMVYNVGNTKNELIDLLYKQTDKNQKCEYLDAYTMSQKYKSLYNEII